jgi:hypothetical protein
VETEQVSVSVRPRAGFEAVDLGFRLARAFWRPLFGSVALTVVPLALAICVLFRQQPWLAGLLIWWLKPLYDRVALSVLSVALLGGTPTIRETLRGLPRLLTRSGLVASLLWLRLTPLRSFTAPVLQLEGLRGRARVRRVRVLGGRESSAAFGLFLACSMFELVIFFAGLQLAGSFMPEGTLGDFWRQVFAGPSPTLVAYEFPLYTLAICAIEPLYVAAGFALYINRRVWLEAWDVELAFRKLERRARSLAGAAALLAVLALWLSLGATARAADVPRCEPHSAQDARACIESVLADPEFATSEQIEFWTLKQGTKSPRLGGFALWLARLLSSLLRFGTWLALGLAVLALVLAVLRGLQQKARRAQPEYAESGLRRGFDLRPESLPADVVGAARARFAAGDAAGALSLLYRGALVQMARRFGVRLPASATEGECEALARGALAGPLAQTFGELACAWLLCAYAHQPPAPSDFDALCAHWSTGFGATA